jgi:hypothetical protein
MPESLWAYVLSSCDPPHDGNNLSFNRGDKRTTGSNNNTIVNTYLYDSRLPAS